MKVGHLNIVAIAKSGERWPIVGVKLASPDEAPIDAARRAYPHCEVRVDARPWALLAGDDASAEKWMQTNRMPGVLRVRTVNDVPARPQDYQVAAVGHWIRRPLLRDAMLRLLMVVSETNSSNFRK